MTTKKRLRRAIIGHVGVDAGMIYIGDPCYVIGAELGAMSWDQFLHDLYKDGGMDARYWRVGRGTGVVTTSGHGDGVYPVEAALDEQGVVCSVTIHFDRGRN